MATKHKLANVHEALLVVIEEFEAMEINESSSIKDSDLESNFTSSCPCNGNGNAFWELSIRMIMKLPTLDI